jgi:hypothetical protein
VQLELREKKYFDECAAREMAQYLHGPKRTVRETLAYAARILAGQEVGLAGQLSARSERSKANWMPRFELGFDEATPDDFIEVGADLHSITSEGMANPATRFHLCIYEARSDLSHRSCSLSLAIAGTRSAPSQPDGELPSFGAGNDVLAAGPSRKSSVTISTRSPIN